MKSIILVTFLLLASIANSAPNCTWKQAETQADIVNDSILAIVGYKCEIKNFDTSLIRDTYKAYILKPNTPQITLEGSIKTTQKVWLSGGMRMDRKRWG